MRTCSAIVKQCTGSKKDKNQKEKLQAVWEILGACATNGRQTRDFWSAIS